MSDSLQVPVAELATLRMGFALVSQPIFILDAVTRQIVEANPAGCRQLNLARSSLIGRPWGGFVDASDSHQWHEIEIQGRRYVVGVHQADVDGRRPDPAAHDALTGLANRRALSARFAVNQNDPDRGPLSLMFLDLDKFKQINDSWGHVFGDRVLQIVAQRLAGSIRKDDLAVRYGGDEFIVLVEGVGRRSDLERRAKQIARAMQMPMLIDDRELTVSVSIGIARHRADMSSAEALISEADRAMYRAKSIRHTKGNLRRTVRLAIATGGERERRRA